LKGDAMRAGLLDAFSVEAGHPGPRPPIIDMLDAPDDRPFLAEADHRIANHLALLTGYVRLQTAALTSQAEEPSRASMHLLLDSVGTQIKAVAMLHRVLSSDGRMASANLAEHLHEICAGFASGLSGQTEIVEDISPGCAVGPDQILPLGQIVAEVITNAVKHAGQGGEPGRVVVGCHAGELGGLLVEISDSGPGFPASFDPETDSGLGFRLLRALGRRLGAQIGFQSTRQGVRFQLTMPAPPPGAVAG
jgi:two-component sensor histidine kinase